MAAQEFLGFSEPFSSWSHLLAALGFFIAGFFLVHKGRGNGVRVTALVLYTFSLVFLFSMSGVFHLLSEGAARDVLRRLDHAGIWVLIAGTFTPIHIILFRKRWRWLILLVVWTIAILGLVLEVVFFNSFPEFLILSLFLGLGWIGALSGYQFRKAFRGESLRFLLAGGIFYSVGAVVDFIRWPNLWPGVVSAHDIFHVFVILAAICHWLFIYEWANHPVANTMVMRVRVFPNNSYVAESIGDHLRVEANSLELLKVLVKAQVQERFHESVIPEIHLIYFNEEKI